MPPPHPHPIVRHLKVPSSTGCSRGLHVHVVVGVVSSRLLASLGARGRRHRELPPSPPSSLARSRRQPAAGRGLFSFIVAAFSRLAPRAAGRACFSSLSAVSAEADTFGTRPCRLPTEAGKPAPAPLPAARLSVGGAASCSFQGGREQQVAPLSRTEA